MNIFLFLLAGLAMPARAATPGPVATPCDHLLATLRRHVAHGERIPPSVLAQLGEKPDPALAEPLARALFVPGGQGESQPAVVAALLRIGGEPTREAIRQALKRWETSHPGAVHFTALETLARLGDPAAYDRLVAIAKGEEPRGTGDDATRLYRIHLADAADTLADIGDPRAVPVLIGLVNRYLAERGVPGDDFGTVLDRRISALATFARNGNRDAARELLAILNHSPSEWWDVAHERVLFALQDSRPWSDAFARQLRDGLGDPHAVSGAREILAGNSGRANVVPILLEATRDPRQQSWAMDVITRRESGVPSTETLRALFRVARSADTPVAVHVIHLLLSNQIPEHDAPLWSRSGRSPAQLVALLAQPHQAPELGAAEGRVLDQMFRFAHEHGTPDPVRDVILPQIVDGRLTIAQARAVLRDAPTADSALESKLADPRFTARIAQLREAMVGEWARQQGRSTLTERQQQALWTAQRVGAQELGRDGDPVFNYGDTDNYTPDQKRKLREVLAGAGLDPAKFSQLSPST